MELINDEIYINIANMIWEKYIRDYIVYIIESSSYIITDNNEILKKKYDKKIYTLDDIINIIDNNNTKYILLMFIKYRCQSDNQLLFIVSDIISDSWKIIISELKKIIIHNSENEY